MTLITINIPDEVKELLKDEKNKSGLITQLLINHYKYTNATLGEIDRKIKEITERQKEQIELMNRDIEKLCSIRQYQDETNKQAKINEEKLKEKERSKMASRNRIFKSITNRDMTEEEHVEFSDKYDKGEMTITDFAESKIVEKENAEDLTMDDIDDIFK